MTEVKICGLKDAAAVDAVAEAGAEWMGFVFFPPSPRALSPAAAAPLARRHPNGPRPVGLFVDPTDDEVAATLDAVPLAVLQVYASAGRAAALQARFGVPVWHAVGVATAADLPTAAPGITRLLLDRKPDPADTRPGGNAAAFDWSVLRGWRAPAPWVLAGGLTPDTVAAAIRQTGAPAVDVSSGVERARGVKDLGLIAAFVRAVRDGEDQALG
jgi:phosphoribosylanthranilate isomerase